MKNNKLIVKTKSKTYPIYFGNKILNKRTKWNNKRPLINIKNRKGKISQLYNQRKNIYKLANHRVNCDNLSIMNIVKKIINIYEK